VKVTAVTGPKGELVAIVHGHLSEHGKNRSKDGPHATLYEGPGQKFHEIEAPAEHEKLPHAQLRDWVVKHLAGKTETRK
jgi:hypothetical protein